jgi:hypothetical protein
MGIGDAPDSTGPTGPGRVPESPGLMPPEVRTDAIINRVRLRPADPGDPGDGEAPGDQQDGLESPKEAEVRGPSRLPRRAILWKTSGYLLSRWPRSVRLAPRWPAVPISSP